jgi:hypothetical protein
MIYLNNIEDMGYFLKKISLFHYTIKTEYSFEGDVYDEVGRKFPRHGYLDIDDERVNYKFHGAGCSVEWGKIDIHYDLAPKLDNKYSVKISPWEYHKYLESLSDDEKYNSTDKVYTLLLEMEQEGYLKKITISEGQFEIVHAKFLIDVVF